jgi:hypothetical protein
MLKATQAAGVVRADLNANDVMALLDALRLSAQPSIASEATT